MSEGLMSAFTKRELYRMVPNPMQRELINHPQRKIAFPLVQRSPPRWARSWRASWWMRSRYHNAREEVMRAIIPCGPNCWYAAFHGLVNPRQVSLKDLVVFHMDESLDWQGKRSAPQPSLQFPRVYGRPFLQPGGCGLRVPEENRHWLEVKHMEGSPKQIAQPPSTSPTAAGVRMGTWPITRPAGIPFSQITIDDAAPVDCPRPGKQHRYHAGDLLSASLARLTSLCRPCRSRWG